MMTENEARGILGLPRATHRHVGADRLRSRVRHVAGYIWLVIAACRCGAQRKELVAYRTWGRAGRLLAASSWEVK